MVFGKSPDHAELLEYSDQEVLRFDEEISKFLIVFISSNLKFLRMCLVTALASKGLKMRPNKRFGPILQCIVEK